MGCVESKEQSAEIAELRAKVEKLELASQKQSAESAERINILTERLERVAALLEQRNGSGPAPSNPIARVSPLAAGVYQSQPQSQPRSLASAPPTQPPAQAPVQLRPQSMASGALANYDQLLQQHLPLFVQNSGIIGGDVSEMAGLIHRVLTQTRHVIQNVSGPNPPSDINTALSPIMGDYVLASKYKDTHNRSEFIVHLSAMHEGLVAFSWVGSGNTPLQGMKEAIDSSQFYVNKILSQYRGKDERHVNWANSWTGLLRATTEYVRANYATGLPVKR